jgi:hypothetical protein
MELFGKDSDFGKSFTSLEGDDANIKVEDIFLYGALPFGQLFMRMVKYGGSLDKPYLLLTLVPSFVFMSVILDPLHPRFTRNIILWTFVMWAVGWIAPLLGYFKLLNKVEGGSILDPIILLPIGIRFLLILLLVIMNFDNTYKDLLMHVVLFFIMMLTNFIHLMIRPQCNSSNNSNHGLRFLKVLMDTFFQYGIIFLIVGMFLKTKMFAYSLYAKPIPYFDSIGNLFETIVWCLGAMFAYIFVNMIDVNYDTDNTPGHAGDDACSGYTSDARKVVSSLIFLIGIIYFVWVNRYF